MLWEHRRGTLSRLMELGNAFQKKRRLRQTFTDQQEVGMGGRRKRQRIDMRHKWEISKQRTL